MGIKLNGADSLDKYIVKTINSNEDVLDKAARIVKQNQYRTLVANVKEWSGNLANSLMIHKKRGERRIGPQQVVAPYAGYIEDGDNSSFLGYHYVRTSIRGLETKLRNLIKASLKI